MSNMEVAKVALKRKMENLMHKGCSEKGFVKAANKTFEKKQDNGH